MATRVTYPLFKAFTANCTFGTGYKLYTYEAGTTTLLTTYQDEDEVTPHANPIVLDSLGEAEIFINAPAKFSLTDADGNVQTNWPVDDIDPYSVTAAEVSYVPSGDLVSTNVQDAIDEIVEDMEDFLTADDISTDTVLEMPTGQEMEGGIVGLDCSADTDTDHDVLVAIGACMDSTNTTRGKLTTAKAKQIDATWAEGDDAGGLLDFAESAVQANTVYLFYALFRDSDGELDFGWVDQSRDVASYLPTGYSNYRFLRFHKTNGSSNICQTTQRGDTVTHHKASDWVVSSGVTTSYAVVDHTAFIPESRVAEIMYGVRDASENNAKIRASDDGGTTASFTPGSSSATTSDNSDDTWSAFGSSKEGFFPYLSTRQFVSSTGTLDLLIHGTKLRR
jgi:hypothetical protein